MKPRQTLVMVIVLSLLNAAAGLYGAEANKKQETVPINEGFAKLDPAWTTHVDKGNTLEVKDGAIEIAARVDSKAHIEQELSVDAVRLSCRIKPVKDSAVASLYVCWDKENCCRIGLKAKENGRIHVQEVLGTYSYDYALGAWPAGDGHYVAVELSKDCIRYLGSADGREYKVLRISRRPERFAATPKLVVLGNGPEVTVFPKPDPFHPSKASTATGTSRISDFEITPLDPARLAATAEEKAALAADERDTLGEQELAANEDPTFESVSRHFPGLKWPREAVGVKDHPHAIGVAHDGTLQLNDNSADYKQPVVYFVIEEPGSPPYRFGSGKTPCTRTLLDGWKPIVMLSDETDNFRITQTVFGYSKNMSPDEPLYAYVRMHFINKSGYVKHSAKIRLRTKPLSDASPSILCEMDVPVRDDRIVCFKIPFAIMESPATEIDGNEYHAKWNDTSAAWDKLIAPGSRFEIPEERVQNAYRAWLAYNFINVHKRGDIYHVCDGSGFYTQVYGYSVAWYCNMMDLLGYHDLAVQYYDSLLSFMKPDGLLAVNFGDTDTGATLYSMSEHYRITRDADWLKRVAPKMLAMCNWIITQRKQALAQAASQPAVTKGLIRYKPYADLLHPAADYFSNSYLCRGLAETADVLAQIGMTDEAARLKTESEAYLKDITTSMEAAVFTDNGMKILPAIPDTRELWKESNGSANGYYGLIVPCILETGIPAWNDPKADLLVNAIRNRGGLMLGISRFHDLVDHAYAYGYWMDRLQRDEVKPAILGLYASMAFGMTRDTYSAVECTAIRTGENYWTLPHTFSNTRQLQLLRNMLVREDGDTLWIGQAIPRPWLAPGKRVAIREAPTQFGPISCSIESERDAITVQLDPPKRTTAKAVQLRLRHFDGHNIASVDSNPKTELTFEKETIVLHDLKNPVQLKVRY